MAKKEDEFRWNSMSKAELIKTVKTLHRRQTKLLNEIASLKDQLVSAAVVTQHVLDSRLPEVEYPEGDGKASVAVHFTDDKSTPTVKSQKLPWETNELPNPFDELKP